MYKRNESNCIMLYGRKGAGKSCLAIRMSLRMDPTFSLDHVVFKPAELFTLIDISTPGQCFVYDEIAVGSNSRDAQTAANKNMSFVAQMVREKCISIFFTTISRGMVDAQVRNLMDFEIKVGRYSKTKGLTHFTFSTVEPRANNPKPLTPHLIACDEDGEYKCSEWTEDSLENDIISQYKQKRAAYFKQVLGDGIATDITGIRHRYGNIKQKNNVELLNDVTSVLNNIDECKDKDGKLSAALIQSRLSCGINRASKLKSIVLDEISKQHTHTI